MTHIINDEQLDYSDVLIMPKRSTLNSRSEPDVYRTYKFKWSSKEICGNGLIVANMATTGTFKMAEKMAQNGMFCALQKHYTYDEIKAFLEKHAEEYVHFRDDGTVNNDRFLDYVFVSTGIKDGDYEKICKILDLGICTNLCIDIANGYIPKLIDFVRKIRERYPSILIMAGNVVTGDMVQDLILAGADICKVGIGGGCFTGDMKVRTKLGLVKIKDIMEGDEVLTHTNHFKKVLTKLCYNHHKTVVKINDIECTPNHRFLVIDKNDRDKVNENNYLDYAVWVEAKDLDKDKHLLLKIK